MYRVISLLFACCFVMFFSAVGFAGDSPIDAKSKSDFNVASDKTSPESIPETTIEETVVTATRRPTPAKELPVRTQIITKKEIAESRASDLSELLSERFPGDFIKYPGGLTALGIRGFRTDTTGTDIKGRVAILIDGHRAGTGNIAAIPLENVERIEIVRGPGSVVYGSAAMGGVVNIITARGRGELHGGANVEGGNWGYFKGAAGAGGGFLKDKLGISLGGRYSRSDDYKSGDGAEILNTEYSDRAFSGSLYAAPHPDHRFFAVGHYFEACDIGSPGPDYAPDYDDNKDILRHYGSLAYDGGLPGSDVTWRASVYRVFDENTFNDPSKMYGYTSSTTETETKGVRTQVNLPTFGFGHLLMGFDYDNIRVSGYTKPQGMVWSPNSKYDNYAVFAEEKVDLNRLSILGGLRYDYFNETIEPTEGLTVIAKDQSFDNVSWRAGAKYSFIDAFSARAAVGSGFRAPAADELAGMYEHMSLKIVGNPDLKPESAVTYEIGLDAVHSGVEAGLGFFYTDYTDRISGGFSACVDGDCTWTTYRNVEGALLSGLEGYIRYEYALRRNDRIIRFIPFTEFTYFTQREVDDPASVKTLGSDTLLYVSEAVVVGGLKVDFDRKVDLTFTSVYNGPQKSQEWNWFSPDYGKAVDKGGFALFHTRLNIHPTRNYTLYLAVDNLFDRSYSYVNGYPMPGRTVRAGVEARF